MLGWWSDAREPAVDAGGSPPRFARRRRRRAAPRAAEREKAARRAAGRIICSCFSVGERAIGEAIASGCRTSARWGR
jgi:assimilatory nitrate reductase catalytic subunit